MSVLTENIMAKFHQKILSGCSKNCKIRQGITFLPHPVRETTTSYIAHSLLIAQKLTSLL